MKTPDFWQMSDHWLTRLLQPIGWLYRQILRLRQSWQPYFSQPVTIICVGNVTAGGAGKTPTVLSLTRLLQALGHRPQLVTRGYGGKTQGPRKIQPSDPWQETGDEAQLLMRQATSWVAKSRLAGCLAAIEAGAELLICDDGFQDRRLQYHTRLLVIDGPYGLGNGLCLPAGPLREPWEEALLRADLVLIIGEDAHDLDHQAWAAGVPCFHARLVADPAVASWLKGRKVAAFAGLGRPEKFRESLQELGADVTLWRAFPDHHPYSERDLHDFFAEAAEQSLTLVTTEKDAVKLPAGLRSQVTVLPVRLELEDAESWQHYWQQRLEEADDA